MLIPLVLYLAVALLALVRFLSAEPMYGYGREGRAFTGFLICILFASVWPLAFVAGFIESTRVGS